MVVNCKGNGTPYFREIQVGEILKFGQILSTSCVFLSFLVDDYRLHALK